MDKAIDRIRRFNRFYTNMLGILDKHILESNFSLSEARVLFEINAMERCTARKIMHNLSIDEGYLSRIIERFIDLGLVQKLRSEHDKRAFMIHLTPKGKTQFQKINVASSRAIGKLIKNISSKDVQMMLLMMDGIENILTNTHEQTKA
jgi:DNA-binding MarR family transcriptional regulator